MRLNIDIFSFILASLSVILFGFFLFQLRWLSLVCLSIFLVLSILSLWSKPLKVIYQLFGFKFGSYHWMALAGISGGGLAIFYRWYKEEPLYPEDINSFAFTAIMIGITEELIFRGYFLGRLFNYQKYVWALLTSSLIHTAYKTAIFSPIETIDLLILGYWTFLVGVLLAYARKKSGSIWPCVLFHALFDLWVYGDKLELWWVW